MSVPIVLLCGQAGVGKDTIGRLLKEKFRFELTAQADPIKKLGKKYFGFDEETLWGPSEKRNEIHASFAQEVGLRRLRFGATGYGPGNMTDPAYGLAAEIQMMAGIPTVRQGSFGEAQCDDAVLGRVRAFFEQLVKFTAENEGLSARIVLQLLGTEVGRATNPHIWTRASFDHAQDMLVAGAPGVVITDGRFRSEVLTARQRGAKVVLITGTGVQTVGAQAHASETELLTLPKHFFDLVIENNKEAGLETLERYIDDAFKVLFPTAFMRSFRIGDLELDAGFVGSGAITVRTGVKEFSADEWHYFIESEAAE